MASQLATLAGVLASADKPLVGIITAGKAATSQANAAAAPVKNVVGTLRGANAKVQALGPKLDETIVLSKRIESKLHILLLLPQIG